MSSAVANVPIDSPSRPSTVASDTASLQDRRTGALARWPLRARTCHLDKIARSFVLVSRHERSCFYQGDRDGARRDHHDVDARSTGPSDRRRSACASTCSTSVSTAGDRRAPPRTSRCRSEPGELVAVVGGSGAGKTTLLETMAGLRRPTSGAVTYDGRSAALPSPATSGSSPRTTSSTARCRCDGRSATPPGSACPPARRASEVDRVVDETLRDLELADRGDVTVGGPVRRAAQASEHRGRAADPSTRLLPRRADLGARPGDLGRRAARPSSSSRIAASPWC